MISESPAISVVIPMHNEEGNAAALVSEIAAALDGHDFEIVAVNDASRDGTLAELQGARADVARLRIVSHRRNAGQSRAVRTGFMAARAAIVCTLDGDGQNPPADLPALIAQLTRDGAPANLGMVGGERVGRQDSAGKSWPRGWVTRFARSCSMMSPMIPGAESRRCAGRPIFHCPISITSIVSCPL